METKLQMWSIDCKQIMQIAREQFYENKNMASAMKMLMDLTNSDELTKEDQETLCLEILMYKKDIVGVYPKEEVKIVECTEKDFDFFETFNDLAQKLKTQEKEFNSLLQKFIFLCERTDDRYLKRLNDSYYFETGEYLFDKDFDNETEDEKIEANKTYKQSEAEAKSYIKRMKDTTQHTTSDYGWLSPNGEFFEADWGEHNEWARKYLEKNDAEYDDVYSDKCTDRLIELHWVLLDNPCCGIATPKYGDFGMTKAQKEFLYDYYMERNLKDEANNIWNM